MAIKLSATEYQAPTLTYHGTLSELTQSQHLVVGGQVVQLAAAFAASVGPSPGPHEPAVVIHDPGNKLPFTGLAVVGVAGAGAALASAGAGLRRLARRPGEPAVADEPAGDEAD